MRAVLRKPDLLILDEATANIDTVTEQLLEEVLESLPKNTTKVIIAHRLNTIDNVDQIFFVNGGDTLRQVAGPDRIVEHAARKAQRRKPFNECAVSLEIGVYFDKDGSQIWIAEGDGSTVQHLVLEAAGGPGGTSAQSGGLIYLGGGTPIQEACGYEDSVEDMFAFLMAACGPDADEADVLPFEGARGGHDHHLGLAEGRGVGHR